jgi:hypothetical protein
MKGTISVVFFTRTQYRVFILWYVYPTRPFYLCILQREWEDGHKKIKEKRKGGIENKGNGGNGYPSGTRAGPSLLIWSDPLCFTSFMLVFFSWMPIRSQSFHSVRLSLFSLCRSQLRYAGLPLFPPISPTRSVSIQLLVTDYRNSAGKW